jgi:RHS repeat-associated protein
MARYEKRKRKFLAEMYYTPFGETRWTNATATPTRRQYTGQINDVGTGLYFYNARYYDPALARFTQADTIVPEPGNPQSLNRFSYTLNNPIRYIDPSGHEPVEDSCAGQGEECYVKRWYLAHGYSYHNEEGKWVFTGIVSILDGQIAREVLEEAGITLINTIQASEEMLEIWEWSTEEIIAVAQGIGDLAARIGKGYGRLKELAGGTTSFIRGKTPFECIGRPACAPPPPFTDGRTVYFMSHIDKFLAVHEFAHVIDWNSQFKSGTIRVPFSSAIPEGPLITSYSDDGIAQWEYWAEAITDYVYGMNYQPLDPNRNPITPTQRNFIHNALRGYGW